MKFSTASIVTFAAAIVVIVLVSLNYDGGWADIVALICAGFVAAYTLYLAFHSRRDQGD